MKEFFLDLLKGLGLIIRDLILQNPLEFWEFVICTPFFIFAIIMLAKVVEFLENFSLF